MAIGVKVVKGSLTVPARMDWTSNGYSSSKR